MALIRGGNNIMKTLGQMIGLLISIYVFDQIIAVVLPLSYNCGTGYTANTTAQRCMLNTNTTNSSAWISIPSNFASSLTFLQSLFGVVGIIGTFEIIYRGLKRSGLV